LLEDAAASPAYTPLSEGVAFFLGTLLAESETIRKIVCFGISETRKELLEIWPNFAI